MKKQLPIITVTTNAIVGGGQAIGTLEDGRKIFVWGALAGETVEVQVTKKKPHYYEGVVTRVITAHPQRIAPRDPESYLSTSPWQIMAFDEEARAKEQLITEAFALSGVVLPEHAKEEVKGSDGTHSALSAPALYSDGSYYGYRNKVEFSFWHDADTHVLSLAFFRRGSHGKIAVPGTSLARDNINAAAHTVLDALNTLHIEGRALKTLIVRASALDDVAWQLYVKVEDFPVDEFMRLFGPREHGEVIYSNPKSPASVITRRLTKNTTSLQDSILGVPFYYAVESFFQINLPVYEQALRDMQTFVPVGVPLVDLYSGVGTIGLTIGGDDVTLVEINESAVREMERNIASRSLAAHATAVLSASETALDYIDGHKTIIVDPPRAGLHAAVIARLLEEKPKRIIYLSCNPVTQARDISLLRSSYTIRAHRGYNFFPRTPHIEHLVVLDLR